VGIFCIYNFFHNKKVTASMLPASNVEFDGGYPEAGAGMCNKRIFFVNNNCKYKKA
jgi:hypothetical protein